MIPGIMKRITLTIQSAQVDSDTRPGLLEAFDCTGHFSRIMT